MGKIPEHEKLLQVAPLSQACGEFIDFIRMKGFSIESTRRGVRFDLTKMLAEYFEIDVKKLEAEKVAMLKKLQEGES